MKNKLTNILKLIEANKNNKTKQTVKQKEPMNLQDTTLLTFKEKFNNKYGRKLLLTACLFVLFFTISYIPIELLNININNFNDLELLIYSFVCNLIFLAIIIVCYYKTLKKDFKPFFKDFAKNFEESFKYYLVGLAIMITSNIMITFIFQGGLGNNEETVRNYIDIAPLLMFIEVAFYAPLAEELLFRKSFREIINNKYLYILISGFIFGALHVTNLKTLTDFLLLIPYCSLGFTFSYIYAKTDNIYSTISIHAMHNAVTLILYFIGANL